MKGGEKVKITVQYRLDHYKQSETDVLEIDLDGETIESLYVHKLREEKPGEIGVTSGKAEILQILRENFDGRNHIADTVQPDGTVAFELDKPICKKLDII